MNAKKWIMIIVVLVVIGGGVWWFTSDSDDDANDATDDTTEVTTETEEAAADTDNDDEAVATTVIVYTDTGFDPANVGPLPAGTTVTFENASSTDNFEPASDPHPTHTDLGGFDSIDPVPVGESYSFTFDEPGEWGFHNHLNPSHTGVLVIQ